MPRAQSFELLSSVIKLLLQRLNESPISPVRSSWIPSLSPLKFYESLAVLFLLLPGRFLSLKNALLSSKQVSFELANLILSLASLDIGIVCTIICCLLSILGLL